MAFLCLHEIANFIIHGQRLASTVLVHFKIDDEYDFDELRSIKGDTERIIKFDFGIGTLANDAALFSQADEVVSPYKIDIQFHKIIPMKGVYL